MEFVASTPEALERSSRGGHVTASAWVVDRAARRAVLVFHPKLHRWLQPGGHLEVGETTLEGSLREGEEETGLSLRLSEPEIFDLDRHLIPARGDEPAHWHYDVRHVLEASSDASPRAESGGGEAKWVAWDEISAYTEARSVRRLVERMRRR